MRAATSVWFGGGGNTELDEAVHFRIGIKGLNKVAIESKISKSHLSRWLRGQCGLSESKFNHMMEVIRLKDRVVARFDSELGLIQNYICKDNPPMATDTIRLASESYPTKVLEDIVPVLEEQVGVIWRFNIERSMTSRTRSSITWIQVLGNAAMEGYIRGLIHGLAIMYERKIKGHLIDVGA